MNKVQQRWATEYGLTPQQFRKLKRMVDHAARLMERATGDNGEEMNKQLETGIQTATNAVNAYAAEIGMEGVRWDDGFYPAFKKNNRTEIIPE